MTQDSLPADSSTARLFDELRPSDFGCSSGSEPSSARSLRHIPALDGVRGLAILLVIVSHATVMSSTSRVDRIFQHATELGWTGVDLFFVLSGFLITGILWDQRKKNHYFRNFYARRVLRIFPLYYAFILVLTVIVPHLPNAKLASLGHFKGSALWYWLYLSNIKISLHGFDNQILGVTWSLAVEEHFYLIWPLVVLLFNRRTLLIICGAIVVIALGLRTALVLHGCGVAVPYVLTPCRMDSLAMGASIALIARGKNGIMKLRAPAMVGCGVCLIVVLFTAIATDDYFWSNRFFQTFGFTAIGVFYSCLLILVLTLNPNQFLPRFFVGRFLRTAGKYSYCLYLVHAIFRSFIRDRVYGPLQFATIAGSQIPGQLFFYILVLGISFVTAIASWSLLESQFLKMKRWFEPG